MKNWKILGLIAAALLSSAPCWGRPKVEYLGPLQGELMDGRYAYQGMDIWNGYVLSCQDRGVASIYRLQKKGFTLEGQFHLATFHKFNHANVVSFGVEKFAKEDRFPVFYVSQCHMQPIDGRKDLLYVERLAPGFSGSERVQTIFYDDVNHDFGYALQWVVDRKHKWLYGYGNTVNNSDPANRHRVIKFRLPALSEGPQVVLKPEDALENYLIEDESGYRFNPIGQGLFVRGGRLYMPTGVGNAASPSILYIWDLKKHRMRALDLSLVTTGEFEDISFYKGRFYIQSQDGLFRLRLGRKAGKEGFDWHDLVPKPVYEARPEYLTLYNKAWELAYNHIDTVPGLPAPVYMDEAHRSDRIWIWDTAFMGHFCKYCPSVFPGVSSLDNFYRIILDETDAPLPMVRGNMWSEGHEGEMLPFQIHIADNPPILAWTEYVYALQTGNRRRLKHIFQDERFLQRWFDRFDSFVPSEQIRGVATAIKLRKYDEGYAWTGGRSGMDNTPRGRTAAPSPHACPDNPDLRWLDALAQQGLSAWCMARIAGVLGLEEERQQWTDVHARLSGKLNDLYWDESDSFYYDIFPTGEKCKVPTIASWWPVLAGMAGEERAARMMPRLLDSLDFGGFVPTPSLSRSDPDFHDDGMYWRGSVWLPTTYMTLKSLDLYGNHELARSIGGKLLEHMYRTYVAVEPHTIWECYSPTGYEPGKKKNGKWSRYDFCGWSALGPISIFIEDVIGIKQADGFEKTLVCDFERKPAGKVGVRGYRFGPVVCDVTADEKTIEVTSNLPFTLQADGRTFQVRKGRNRFAR